MSTITDVLGAGTRQIASGGSIVKDTESRFLTLLVAQMKHQDPLNPLDNAQVTTQLAQLSTVSGIEELNESVLALVERYRAAEASSASALIGRDVLVPGDRVALVDGQAVFGVDLAGPAEGVRLHIYDIHGELVHTRELGAQAPGTLLVAWDGATDAGGTAVDGHYRFELIARGAEGEVKAQPLAYARVLGVAPEATGVRLQLDGGASALFSDVKQIL